MSVPAGVCRNNVPSGMQIAGRPYDDITVAMLTNLFAEAAPPMPFGRVFA
jgi:Asp-tRNA(Asn)/Glu-tRNA(Gln) amidotransferase A subunit family amidase